MRTGGHQGTVRGYLYGDSSNNFGLLGSTGGWRLRIVENDWVLIDGSSIRAQLFYDSNDTSYYVDANSTSYQRSLFLGAHDSGTSEFRFGEDSSGWYGDRWYWDSAYTLYRYSRYAGTDSLIHYHDTRDASRITYGRNIVFDNYGKGIIGLYSASVFQLVFAMGDAYKTTAGGGINNLYGIAWSHPNAGGIAGNLNTHGALITENGTFLAAISGSIRCRDDMRAPIFYDSNDASYYLNPNGDSSLYTAKFWGNSITIRGGSPTLYFQDSDQMSAMLHNNSNLLYILRGGVDTTSWSQVGGYWPVYWDLSNNNATFGGAIWAAGNITAYSDAKLKENVETVTSALDKTLALRGVYYTLIRDETKTRKLGVLAQEVQKVIPEVVMLHQDKEDKEGTLSVDYGNITALLIEAIKEQQLQIEELKALIKK